MKYTSLNDLYVAELRDLYSAENQLLTALPQLAEAASAPALVKAFVEHLEKTRGHVARLEDIFRDLEANPRGHHCRAMEGLVEESREAIDSADPSPVRDAALIVAAQRIEHYEMAGYGCVRTFAQTLGHEEAAQQLQLTLEEEAAADENLSVLAENVINDQAAHLPAGSSPINHFMNEEPDTSGEGG
jgi:ferritin-like metal-binding protein YciE